MFRSGVIGQLALAEPKSARETIELMRSHYSEVSRSLPPEYVFKNEIANQLFLKNHNPDISVFSSEFRVGSARLDIVVVNGTTTCYEIKTDRDELRRLPAQIDAAVKVFDKTYVVTTERFSSTAEILISSKPQVGLYVLLSSGKIKLLKRALSNKTLVRTDMIFDCLRRAEYVQALRKAHGAFPRLPNTQVYTEAKKRFVKLDPVEAHAILASALRKRHAWPGDGALIPKIPYELRALYLTGDPKQRKLWAESQLWNLCEKGIV